MTATQKEDRFILGHGVSEVAIYGHLVILLWACNEAEQHDGEYKVQQNCSHPDSWRAKGRRKVWSSNVSFSSATHVSWPQFIMLGSTHSATSWECHQVATKPIACELWGTIELNHNRQKSLNCADTYWQFSKFIFVTSRSVSVNEKFQADH